MLGVLMNAAAVLLGGLIGLLFGEKIKKKYTDALLTGLALVCGVIGIISAIATENILCMIVCVSLGTLVGELMKIEAGVERLGAAVQTKMPGGNDKGSNFTLAFVSCSILYCVGSMTVMGSIEAGINGDNSVLYTKSVIDFVSSIAYSAALGPGAVLSFACVLFSEGALTLLASAVGPFLTTQVVTEMSAVGGVVLLGLTVNLLGLRDGNKIKIANMLPAIFLPAVYIPFTDWLGRLL